MRKWIAGLLLLCAVFLAFRFGRQSGDDTPRNPQSNFAAVASNSVAFGSQTQAIAFLQTALSAKVEELKQQALGDFEKIIPLLKPYGSVDHAKQTYVQQRTNRDGSVKIEIEVRTATHKAAFRAGPLDSVSAAHVNPSQPPGLHLNLFESLYDGEDTRRKPEAIYEWYRSTGTWSEAQALAETKRILSSLGIPEIKIAKHRFRPSTLTVKNPAGEPVRVTPFYRVDVYDKKDTPDEDPGSLYIQYRIDEGPEARVTRLFAWPPIKVP